MDDIIRAARELAQADFALPDLEGSSSDTPDTNTNTPPTPTPRARSLTRHRRGRTSQRLTGSGSVGPPVVRARPPSSSPILGSNPRGRPGHASSVSATIIPPVVLTTPIEPPIIMATGEEAPKGVGFPSKFVGVAHGDEGRRLMRYTVDQFLQDMEALIACRQVTDDQTKIHLARLHIHQSVGDAFKFVNCPDIRAITSWAEFTRRLKRTYKTAYVSEPLLAVAEYVTMPVATSLLDLALEFAHRRDTSIASMKSAKLIEIGDLAYFRTRENTDQLVRLHDFMHLVGQAVLYGHLSESNRKIFRDSKVNATETISTLTEAIREKAGKDIIAEDAHDVFAVYQPAAGRTQNRPIPQPASSTRQEANNTQEPRTPPKTKEKCPRCKKKGHTRDQCRVKLEYCEYCGRDNHTVTECRDKQQAERRIRGKGVNPHFGPPFSNTPPSPSAGGAHQRTNQRANQGAGNRQFNFYGRPNRPQQNS